MWGAVAGAGGAAGVLLGGILTTGLSWRWVLFVNVPISLVCASLAPRLGALLALVLISSRDSGSHSRAAQNADNAVPAAAG